MQTFARSEDRVVPFFARFLLFFAGIEVTFGFGQSHYGTEVGRH